MKEENYREIKDYLNIIRKRILFILITTVFSTLAAGILSFYVLKPVYEATSTIIVGKDNADKITQSEVMMYQSLIKTYSEIAKSRVVAENAAEKVKLETLADEFMANVSIKAETGTQIIDISYRDKTPEIAAQRANAYAQGFIEESQKLLPSGSAGIMDKAPIPKRPITPNKKVNIAIGFMLGLLISFGLVLLDEYLNNTIKNEEDAERYLGLPVIGLIPKQNKMVNLIVGKEPKSPVTEAFKSMRTNLLFAMENRGVRTLMVCSSCPEEGKTSVSTNIGYVIAQTGKKVLLIDCDLRRPSVHRHFNISNDIGLVDIVLKGGDVKEIVSKIEINFDVLTAGRLNYNPSEVLSSQRMKAFIREMEGEYDYVILDTPPVIGFTDAMTMVTEKIGVLLVISSQETKIEICKKSKQLLLNINAVLIGNVLNKVDKRSMIGYGYDYTSYNTERDNKLINMGKRKKINRGDKTNVLEV